MFGRAATAFLRSAVQSVRKFLAQACVSMAGVVPPGTFKCVFVFGSVHVWSLGGAARGGREPPRPTPRGGGAARRRGARPGPLAAEPGARRPGERVGSRAWVDAAGAREAAGRRTGGLGSGGGPRRGAMSFFDQLSSQFSETVSQLSDQVKEFEKSVDQTLGLDIAGTAGNAGASAAPPALAAVPEAPQPVRAAEEGVADGGWSFDAKGTRGATQGAAESGSRAESETTPVKVVAVGPKVPEMATPSPSSRKPGRKILKKKLRKPVTSASPAAEKQPAQQEAPGERAQQEADRRAHRGDDDQQRGQQRQAVQGASASGPASSEPEASAGGGDQVGVRPSVGKAVEPQEPAEITSGDDLAEVRGKAAVARARVAELEDEVGELRAALAAAEGGAAGGGAVEGALRAEVERLKKAVAESIGPAEVEALREEFGERLSASERKVYALSKERDMLKREVAQLADAAKLVRERDQTIAAVMEEGEALSKKQASQEASMRKLRGLLKEAEGARDTANKQLETERAAAISSRAHADKMEQKLAQAVEHAAREVTELKEAHSAELASAKAETAKSKAAESAEAQADLNRRVEQASEIERDLNSQIAALQDAAARREAAMERREKDFAQEREEMEERCRAAEARHEELAARVPEATRPLLRQIEAMQSQATSRAEAWEAVERSLTRRCEDAEAASDEAEIKCSAACELADKLKEALAEAEATAAAAAEREAGAVAEAELMRAQTDALKTEAAEAAEAQAYAERSAERARSEAGRAAEAAKGAISSERDRAEAAEHALKRAKAEGAETERALKRQIESLEEVVEEGRNRAVADAMSARTGMGGGGSAAAAAAAVATGAQATRTRSRDSAPTKGPLTIELLQEQVRRRDAELDSLEATVRELEAMRTSLADELVLSAQRDASANVSAAAAVETERELKELQARHAAALELMGERDEEVEELRNDLADVKTLYREQVDELAGLLEREREIRLELEVSKGGGAGGGGVNAVAAVPNGA